MKIKYMLPLVLVGLNSYANTQNLESVLIIGQQESYFEEVSSTSMKGEFDTREIPYTVSVTKDTLMDDIQAQRLEDTYDYTTGLTKVGKNADAINIRGFETNLQNLQVNGMSGLISRMGSPSTANVERIEVVKGPASVLYGAMQPGGFVNIQTKIPQAKSSVSIETSFQTYISNSSSSGLGSDNGLTTTFDATGPISKDLYYRFIAVGEKLNSYRDNVDFENLYIYPSLFWNISDETSLLVALEYGNEEGSADDGLIVANHDISTVAPINTVYQEKNDFDNDEGTALDLKLEHYFSNNLSYNFAWRSVFHNDERKLFENRKVNNTNDIESTTLTRRNRHQYNERDWHNFDTNFNYDTNIAKLSNNFVLGLSGNYRKTDYDRLIFGGIVSPDISIYKPIHGGTATAIQTNRRKTEFYSTGIYLQDKLNLTDNLTLVASTRVDRTKVDFVCLRGSCASDNTKYSTDFVGSLGTIYNINDVVSVYGSVAQSYDPSTAERIDSSGKGLDSEESKQYEIGTKLNFSHELNTVFSIYKIYKENVAEYNSTGGYYELKGEMESEGFEAEVQWLPIQNWQFKTGYSYNHAEYVAGSDIGNRPSNNPKSTAYIFTRYNIPRQIYGGTFGFTSGIVYRDKIYTSSSNTNKVELPSYTRLDLGVHYTLKDWEMSFNIENITDKKYFESGTNDYKIYAGEPRKLTFSVKKTF